MRTSPSTRPSTPALAAVAILAALAGAAPGRAQLGDRALLNTGGGGDPYVMILFDTSGSMAWGTECDADDRAAGLCSHDCPAPNCPRPMNGDDPDSKIYQAKQAFYEAMYTIDGVRWGFASLNQDELAVGVKHWLYEVTASTGSSSVAIPAVGWQEVFGAQTGGSGDTAFDMTCDRNGGGNSSANGDELYEMGCYMTSDDAPNIDETDTWTLEKLRRLPKGGAIENPASVSYFMRPSSGGANRPYYRITYASPVVDYTVTDTFTITVTIQQCLDADVQANKTSCGATNTSWTAVDTRSITYEKVGEFLWWEGTVSSDTSNNSEFSKDAYFGGRTDGEPTLPGIGAYASAIYAEKTCRGWDPSGNTWGQQGPGVFTDVDPNGGTSYNLRFPTTGSNYTSPDPTQQWLFERGDVLPLDWDEANEDDNLDAVLRRFNPQHPTYDPSNVDPDLFAQSPYFADSYGSGETFLRLKTEDDGATSDVDEAIRPLVAHGSTPLAGWFSMFRHWYSGCGDPGNCSDEFTGWADIAAQFDPTFACTAKYVLMLTDGAETCDGSTQENSEDYYEDNIEEFPDGFSKTADQCRYRASLSAQEDIETLVIGFGVENREKLQCANTPVYFANNVGELRALLTELLGQIKESAAAFASAAVPTVQANILDKVYLSSFVPLNDTPVWPGRLDSFLKPLPLEGNLPDRSTECGTTLTAECFAFDAGDSQLAWNGEADYDPDGLLLQAPLESQIDDYATTGLFDSSTLQLGDGEEERRVYFGLPDSPSQKNRRMLFDFPADPADPDDTTTEDLEPDDLTNYEAAFEISPIAATVPERRTEVADIVKYTLQEKQAQIDFLCTAGDIGRTCTVDADCDTEPPPVGNGPGDGVCTADAKIQYVMGDIFHSNPLILNPPADFEYFTKDLYWPVDPADSDPGSGLCGDSAEDTVLRGPQISYAWYSNKNLCRRVSMFVGTNEGQLHAFDGGLFEEASGNPECRLWFAKTADDPDLSDQNKAPHFGGAGGPDTSNSVDGQYDFGTGREIFSFIPDFMMPLTKQIYGMAATCSAGAAASIGETCTLDSDCGESVSGAADGDCSGGETLTTQWGVDGTPLAVDVFVDPYVAPNGSVDCRQRVWRTILLSNYREGGAGLFALDITQPDTFDVENVPTPIATASDLDYVPSCSDPLSPGFETTCNTFCRQQAGNVDTDCAKLAYPALRWEFRDLDADGEDDTGGTGDECDDQGEPADDDCNGQADLAETWSRPFVARLPFCDGACDTDAEPEDRYVAIFGGGISEAPFNDASDVVGNWLYMVDIETGKPLYKRGGTGTSSPIVGSVPADIAGVDEDFDGYIDTLYFGTTAGFVYKVDIELAAGEEGHQLDADGLWADPAGDAGRFDPFQVFSTEGKPIYLEIGAVYVPRRRANAILFGTGNRSNLWDEDGNDGRFFALLDEPSVWKDADRDGFSDAGVLTEASYPEVDPDSGVVDAGITDVDLLYGVSGYSPGWFFSLGENEKLITEPFTLTGITFFTIYDPLIVESGNSCANSGESKIFIVNTVTTEGYAIAAGAGTTRTRYFTAPTFTTQPFVEYSATKNPGASGAGSDNADAWTEELAQINRELRRLLPSGCKFSNYTLDIKTVRSDTGLVFIAPVPVCIEPHNWKEF